MPIRLLAGTRAFWFYLEKIVLPRNLMMIYPRWHIDPRSPISYLPGILGLGAFLLFWGVRKRWGRPWLFAFAYFLFALAPVMGIFNVNFFTCSQVSDHLQYLAVPGIIAFLAAGLARVLQSFNPAVFRSLAAVLALVLCVLTWQHQKPFANSESLWQHNLAGNPNSWKMHNGLGTALAVNGKVEAAVDEFKAALRTAPDHGDLHFNLAHALRLTGRLDEAIEQYRIALQGGPHLANAHNDLGNLLLQRGRGPEAIAQYQAAIDLHPANPLFLNNLAWLMATCPQASVRNGARAVELAQQAERLSGGKNSAMLGTLAAGLRRSRAISRSGFDRPTRSRSGHFSNQHRTG